jgi:competence ComEA-like helix-hairpin-helix protein
MASISLRAYNSEVESMIERDQVEEAVAHCMHILQSVPKHIATYRLLGKALLEMQRYTDATDILNRVLSSLPDDFVSHVGMSIIRENESNLDGAIWHMERAYEVQPANAAIQDELRRLYGRRDGMEPPKIRLTRGALARMYAKGQLFQQAIGELQAALAEDDRRPDLQVQLALMYYSSGQREQSIRVCSDLLKKLPYCLEANRILADLLPESTTSGTQSYRGRLISLDPYYAHTEPSTPTSERVPANAVVLERLDYLPGQSQLGAPKQPDWAVSLGAPFQVDQEGALPEWVSSESADETAVTASATEEVLPDFLKEAGWTPTDRSADAIAMEEIQKEQEAQISDEIEPAEIPDWLREIAPEGSTEIGPDIEVDQILPDEEVLPWLQESEPGPTDSVVTWLQETQDTVSEQELQDLESALQEASPEVEALDTSWLSGEAVGDIAEAPEVKEEGPFDLPSSEEPLPEWMAIKDEELEPDLTFEEEAESTTASQEELPDWLREAEQEPSSEAEDLPDWLKGIEGQAQEPIDLFTETAESSIETVDQAAEVEETAIWQQPVDLGQPEAELPGEGDWSLEDEEFEVTESVEYMMEPATDTDDLTKWLESLDEGEPEEALETTAESPGWLAGEIEEATPLEDTQPTRIVPPVVEAMPEATEAEMESAAEIEVEAEEMETTIQAAAEPVALADLNLDDPDAALAWLESLAAQQGAAADQLTTRPEDRPETPEWIKLSAAEAELRGDLPAYEPTETVEGLEKSAAELEEPIAPEEAIEPAMETSDTLVSEEFEPEEPAVAEIASEAMEVEELAAEELAPEELASELVQEIEAEVEALPEWMAEFEEEPFQPAIEEITDLIEPEVEPEAEAGLPDWLKEGELAESTEDTQPTVVSAGAEGTPEWMLESELVSEIQPEETPVEEEALPDWLSEEALELEKEVEVPEWIDQALEVEIEAMEEMETRISARPTPAKTDLNIASLAELEKLPGIGFILAQSILNHREANGPFDRIEDLQEIPGIGPDLVEELKEWVEVQAVPIETALEERMVEPLLDLEDEETLMTARQALINGELESAVELNSQLIQRNLYLGEIIKDLQDAVYQHSSEIGLWETLGDAYVRNNQLNEALDAYLRAEELIK